jgi:transcriptional regulator GlxA family with amidase domain
MRTSARSLAVVLFDELELLDVAGPLQVLTMAGRNWNYRPFKVWSLSRTEALIDTRSQLRLEAALRLSDCSNPELVLVPGGYGARRALDDQELVSWLKDRAARAEFVLSVGHGSLLLARAGLLSGREVAAADDTAELLAAIDPTIACDRMRRVVQSGNVLTAATSSAGIDLGLTLLLRLLGNKLALGVAEKLGHDWRPDAGAPDTLRIEILPPVK